MIATVYLTPCPICPPGKNCKGHVDDRPTTVAGFIYTTGIRSIPKKPSTPQGEVLE